MIMSEHCYSGVGLGIFIVFISVETDTGAVHTYQDERRDVQDIFVFHAIVALDSVSYGSAHVWSCCFLPDLATGVLLGHSSYNE